MKRKIFFICFTIITLMCACSSDPFDGLQPESNASNQPSVSALVDNFRNSFKSTVTRNGDVVNYPSYFGGLYATNENVLTILVTGEPSSYKDDFIQRCQSDNIEIRKCDYSYSDLFDVMDILDTYKTNNVEQASALKFYGYYLTENTNSIHVVLGDVSESNVSLFKNQVIDFPNLIFELGQPMVLEATLAPGSEIIRSSNSWMAVGSIGFRATKQSVMGATIKGFVVSGHVAQATNVPMYSDQTRTKIVGQVEDVSLSGEVDAAFCSNKNGYEVGVRIPGTFFDLVPQAVSTSSMYTGMYVNLAGCKTKSSGIITTTFGTMDGTYKSVIDGQSKPLKITGMMGATYASASGDSGGVIYSDDYKIAGIHEGTANGTHYFIPVQKILNKWGLSLY